MKPYLKLLMAREGKEVLGKHYSNLWLLTLVLTAMFSSIAFSHGSMLYLQDKMEDPFTNWVDIPIAGKNANYKNFADKLDDPQLQEKFGYTEVHNDGDHYYDFANGKKDMYVHCRHLESYNTNLVRKILDEENVIGDCVADSTVMQNPESIGLIVAANVVTRLGYSLDNPPAYVYYKSYNAEADSLGYDVGTEGFLPIPLPVIAVVRRLPNNVDMMATNYLARQFDDPAKKPLDFMSHIDYTTRLRYFVPEEARSTFEAIAKQALPDSMQKHCRFFDEADAKMTTWRKGSQVVVDCANMQLTAQQWLAVDRKILKSAAKEGVERIYHYDMGEGLADPPAYTSISFSNLENIRAFENFAKEEHGVQLDMSLVASKENFNAVTVMARVLSSAMVLFSLVCIIMFLVNMLQSYFQKVKRNIGTFKAFGMNAAELIYVYTLILIMIVCSAVVMAFAITWLIQVVLPVIGIEKDGFNYLSLWNSMTYVAAIVVVVSTVATVGIVMRRMLSQTPGDLIYDRN